ncbi:MAG: hypothetical protein E7678_06880 [Ruminococcaceae bacterium]|nr:hypothetical protein [Oscillospiraceae bacterium]
MIFVYKNWDKFCKKLKDGGTVSKRISDLFASPSGKFMVLKHDVETDVKKAYTLAEIENKYSHKGTYYVQAYLLDKTENVELLQKMQRMGHEISYHYDVLDSSKGDIDKAISEFDDNLKKFESCGFEIKTLCQHGNPIVERVGYHSNRDFLRNERVQALYPEKCDVMVDLKTKAGVDYDYYSDAGRKFKFIFDPINNDIVNSDDKNISYKNLDVLYDVISSSDSSVIISTHPHRWTKSKIKYVFKTCVFKCVKTVAKLFAKIPFFKKIMSKYYYLAKKI